MNRVALLLCALMAFSFIPYSAMAQPDEIPEAGWAIGWEEEFSEGPWMLSESGTLTLEFWAENYDPYPLELNLEYEADLNASIDLPDSINIGAQSNMSTTIEIENVTVLDFLAGSTGDITITATRANPVEGGDVTIDPSNSQIEGKVIIPRIADLRVELQALGFTLTSGTTATMEVLLINDGNIRDKVVSPTLIANGCPQLSLIGIGDLDGVVVDSIHDGAKNPQTTAEITLSPASSHPTKTCTIEIAVVSDGGGGTSISTQEVDIKAAKSSSDEGSSSNSNGNGTDSGSSIDGDDDDGASINTDFLPAPGIIITGVAFAVAAIMRRPESQSQ